MHFILTRRVEMPHMTDQTVYISLYVHILPTLSYLQLTNRDGLKENYELSYLSFSFYDIIFRVANKIITLLSYSYFIEHHCSSMSKASSVPKEPERPLSTVSTPWGPRYRGTDIELAHRSILKRKFRHHYLI